jgi:surface polysaccharide O-acyltransferase-like enzyme
MQPSHTLARVRRTDVDAMRVVGSVMVVTIHATAPFVVAGSAIGATYWVALLGNEASRSAVPIFLAISGWTLLTRTIRLRERLVRLLVPLATWTAIYVGEATIRGTRSGSWIGDALFGPGVREHLWFFYFLIPIVVVVWLVRQPQASWAYGAVAALVVVARSVAGVAQAAAFWIGYAWGIGYVGVGYPALEGRPQDPRLAWLLYAAATAALVVGVRIYGVDSWPVSYASPLVLLAAVAVIWGLRPVSRAMPLAPLTLGVYLVHPLVLDVITNLTSALRPELRLALDWGVAIPASFALVWVWHRSSKLSALLG